MTSNQGFLAPQSLHSVPTEFGFNVEDVEGVREEEAMALDCGRNADVQMDALQVCM
jgi:hypothetical protein